MDPTIFKHLPMETLINEIIRLGAENVTLREQLVESKINAATAGGVAKGLQLAKMPQILKHTETLKEVLNKKVFDDFSKFFTIDHLLNGDRGIARYAIDYPLKGRVTCINKTRKILIYKDDSDNVITDNNIIMPWLADSLINITRDLWNKWSPHYSSLFLHSKEYTTLELATIIRKLGDGKKMAQNQKFLDKIRNCICNEL